MTNKNNDMVKLLVGVLVLALVLLLVVPCLKNKKTPGPQPTTNPTSNPVVTLTHMPSKSKVLQEWNNLVSENPEVENVISAEEYVELSSKFSPEELKEHFLNEGFEDLEPSPNNASAIEEGEVKVELEENIPPISVQNGCYPKDVLNAGDLLPADANSQWAQANPGGQGSLSDKNFLNAGYHVGVNTVGQSLRNANRQLRSDPPNPQTKVSPWMQTTIEPDINRKPFEVGS